MPFAICQTSEYYWKFLTLWKYVIESYNKTREVLDRAEVFPHNLQHKGDISFDFQKKSIVVVISRDLSLRVFLAEIPHPEKTICGSFRTFLQIC